MASSSSATTTVPSSSMPFDPTPFFPPPSSLVPPPRSADNEKRSDLAKMVLEWLFLVIALVTIAGIISYRMKRLRQANRPLSHFFRARRSTPGSPTSIQPYRQSGIPYSSNSEALAYYPYLTPVAPTYHQAHSRRTRTRTHAADVDSSGRRLGGGGDHDDLDDKDILPPYDHAGGPPKYVDLENQFGRPMFIGFNVSQTHNSASFALRDEPAAPQTGAQSGSQSEPHENTSSQPSPAAAAAVGPISPADRPLPPSPAPSSPLASSPRVPALPANSPPHSPLLPTTSPTDTPRPDAQQSS
ncbi:hypothetical protein HGRIS_007156 [Hohenbuehelia grisea]|uniref:Uncharacterized protein n=1 Tax=Hohenbuehelia grisea TaxID=104357 RepID=A0ABR3JBK0_9AGAR